MANYTGANVTDVVEIETYQPDVFGFGIASNDSKVTHYISQTYLMLVKNILKEINILLLF